MYFSYRFVYKSFSCYFICIYNFIKGPPVAEMVLRVQPLKIKSTKLPKSVRNAKDAPRKLHLSTMLLNNDFMNDIAGKSILLWDDVVTWGNTSEGARNLLLLAGTIVILCWYGLELFWDGVGLFCREAHLSYLLANL